MKDFDSGCAYGPHKWCGFCGSKYIEALELQIREAAKMASILLDYIHAVKCHEGVVENCGEGLCPATIEFLNKWDA